MISIVAALAFFSLIVWMGVKKRFMIFLLAFPLVHYCWRLICCTYMDATGPLYATQLEHDIGGGYSAVALSAALFATLLPFLFVFRESKLRPLREMALRATAPDRVEHGARMANLFFILAAGYVAALYLELAFTGVVPVSSGMERWEYSDDYGGIFHRFLMRYGNLFSFWLGLFYAQPAGRVRWRFLALLLILFFYLFLTGHRFSMFYSAGTFFIISRGIHRIGAGTAAAKSTNPTVRRIGDWKTVPLLITAFSLLAGLAIYRSYTTLRATDPGRGWQMFEERVLVQQGELWTSSYERVFENGDYDPEWAVRRLFTEPLVADKNSTTSFLMEVELGSKVTMMLEYGAYSGGYPEILFELFGPVVGYLAVLAASTLIALLLRYLSANVLQYRYLGAFFAMYVLYAFQLLMTSGMLNFLTNWSFWGRVGGLLGTTLMNPRSAPPPRPLPEGPEAPFVSPSPSGRES